MLEDGKEEGVWLGIKLFRPSSSGGKMGVTGCNLSHCIARESEGIVEWNESMVSLRLCQQN